MLNYYWRLFKKTLGVRHLIFGIIILVMSFTEHLVFHVEHNQGWWSLHTDFTGIFDDAWHFFKNLNLLIIILFGYIARYKGSIIIDLIIYALLSVVVHWLFFHYIFGIFI